MRKLEKIKKLLAILVNTTFILQIAFFGVLFLSQKTYGAISTNIVISEVQITEGAGKTTHDFIELYNPSEVAFNLKGCRLVKRTEMGTSDSSIKSWTSDTFMSPHSYYLWASSSDSSFPGSIGADVFTSETIAADNGIALRQGDEDAGIVIDSLAWGSASNIFVENTTFATNPGSSRSLERKARLNSTNSSMAPGGLHYSRGNAWDTDDNSEDFILKTTSEPQNSGDSAENPHIKTPEKTKVVIRQNPPLEDDEIVGFPGAVEPDMEARIYKSQLLGNENLIASEDSQEDGSFGPVSIDDNKYSEVWLTSFDGEEESESIVLTNDITPPTLEILITPDPARAGEVEVKVVSQEPLKTNLLDPTIIKLDVSVAQKGQPTPTAVSMKKELGTNIYLGTYSVISPGYDGEATVFASGPDLVGNLGTITGSFRVDTTSPQTPGWIIATPYEGKANLSWGKATDLGGGIGGYKIYYGPQSNLAANVIDVGNITSFDIYNLTNGVLYYFYVSAYDKAGNEGTPTTQVSVSPAIPEKQSPAFSLFSTAAYAASSFEVTESPKEIKGDEVAIGTGEKKEKETEPLQEKKLSAWTIVLLLILLFIGLYLYSGQKGKLLGWFAKTRSKK